MATSQRAEDIPIENAVDLDPALKSLSELHLRVQNPDTSADVRKSIERILTIFEKKEKYWLKNTVDDSPNARMIREKTSTTPWEQLHKKGKTMDRCISFITSFPGEGEVLCQFLQFLIRMQKAKQVLEIGMFRGNSAMAMAESLPEDGTVVTCEIDPYLVDMARKEFDKTPFEKKIEIRQGPAAESLDKLATEGLKFDLIYLDADKDGYLDYFKKILDKDLLAADGTLVVDNTFGLGRAHTETINMMDEFNKAAMADERVEQI